MLTDQTILEERCAYLCFLHLCCFSTGKLEKITGPGGVELILRHRRETESSGEKTVLETSTGVRTVLNVDMFENLESFILPNSGRFFHFLFA